MPNELRKAHKANDNAVLEAYGFDKKTISDENEGLIVAELFKLYQSLTNTIAVPLKRVKSSLK